MLNMLNAGLAGTGLMAALAAGGAAYQRIETGRDARRHPPPGRLVEVDGRRLHIFMRGEDKGGPTVVLDPGLGQASLAWELVAPEVAKFTRVVAYDRAGYAWSESGPVPRAAGRLAEELQKLLKNAGIPGPYVLVVHSMSGLTARLFAARFPEETAGMVLVDTVHEDLWSCEPRIFDHYFGSLARRFRLLVPVVYLGLLRLVVQFGFTNAILPGFVTQQPANIRPTLLTGYLSGKNFAAAVAEADGLKAGAEQVRETLAAGSPADLSLVVLSHGVPSMFSGLPAEKAWAAEQSWQKTQSGMAARSSRGRLVVAEESGHDVHVDRPDLVVEAIRQVVEESRR